MVLVLLRVEHLLLQLPHDVDDLLALPGEAALGTAPLRTVETRVRGEEQLPQGNTSTSSKADACTQVTPTVRFEDEAKIETSPEASSSQTPPGGEITRDTTDQEMKVKKDTAKEH